MRIVAISDTHLYRPVLPDGDVLLHTGDLTYRGLEHELKSVNEYFAMVKHQFKFGIIFIAGNHDLMFQTNPTKARTILSEGVYLQDSGADVDGIKIYGTPWVSQFGNWAFMGDEDFLEGVYGGIPKDTDILLCHGPAHNLLDKVDRGENTGSKALLANLMRVKPAVFIHGHIHDEYGEARLNFKDGGSTLVINAATCDDRYQPVHPPVVLEVENERLTEEERHGPKLVIARS